MLRHFDRRSQDPVFAIGQRVQHGSKNAEAGIKLGLAAGPVAGSPIVKGLWKGPNVGIFNLDV